MTSCFEFEQLISQKLDHELSEAEEEILTSHLQTCADCRALYEDLSHLQEAFSSFTVSPPPYLHSQIMDRIKVDSTVTTPESRTPIQKHLLSKWFTAAAALILLISGTVLGLQINRTSPGVTLAENETCSISSGAEQKSMTPEQEIKPEENSQKSSIRADTEKDYVQQDASEKSVTKKSLPKESTNSKLQKSIINNNPPTSDILSESEETDSSPPPTDSEDSFKEQALGSRSLSLLPEGITYQEAENLLSQYLSKEGSSSPQLAYQGLSSDTESYLFLYTDDSGQRWNYSVARVDGKINCDSTS